MAWSRSEGGAEAVRRPREEGAAMLEEVDRQIDNRRTRVTRHRMAPGAHTGFHRHEHDYVIVPVTDGRMRVVEAGTESVADLAAGVSYFRSAGVEHDVFNGGDQELVFVEIEFVS
jgi:beta-alanine degradation protein BauB